MIGLLQNARKKGKPVYFDKEHFGCPGGAYYMGFLESPGPILNIFSPAGSRERWMVNDTLRHQNWPENILR